MKRRYSLITPILVFIVVFAGCSVRNLTPPPQGQNNQGSMISATYEKADIDYAVVTADAVVKSGTSANASNMLTLKRGTAVKVLGKIDSWYVVLPSNNIVGLIPISSTVPQTTAAPQTIPNVQNTTGTSTLASDETNMVSLVNAERAKIGASALSINPQLTQIARLKSQDIATKNYFSHTSPTYGSPFEMMKTYGISYLYAGENLALNATVQAAHQALMNSPGHKANILNKNFNQVGIGVVTKSDGSRVYTQMFIGR